MEHPGATRKMVKLVEQVRHRVRRSSRVVARRRHRAAVQEAPAPLRPSRGRPAGVSVPAADAFEVAQHYASSSSSRCRATTERSALPFVTIRCSEIFAFGLSGSTSRPGTVAFGGSAATPADPRRRQRARLGPSARWSAARSARPVEPELRAAANREPAVKAPPRRWCRRPTSTAPARQLTRPR